MSFTSSASSLNPSLAWSMGDRGRAPIEFPGVLNWYDSQPCKKFESFQHRKEPHGFRHEYIVLNLTNGSICRIERTGDPNARFDALSSQGSVAHDFIECFRPKNLKGASLDTSDVIAQVHLPRQLDIFDVLRICRAIREGEKTRSYTLQGFNCYFFSLAIQSCLTRLVAEWEDVVPCKQWATEIKRAILSSAHVRCRSLVPGGGDSAAVLLRAHALLNPHKLELMNGNGLLRRIQGSIESRVDLDKELVKSLDSVLWYRDLPTELRRFGWQVTRSTWMQALRAGFIISKNLLPHAPTQEMLESPKRECLAALVKLAEKVNETPDRMLTRKTPLRPMAGRRDRLLDDRMWEETTHQRDKSYSPANLGPLTIAEWILIFWIHTKTVLQWVLCLFWWFWGAQLLEFNTQHDPCIFIEKELDVVLSRLEDLEHIRQQDLTNFLHTLEALEKNPSVVWNQYVWTEVCQDVGNLMPPNTIVGQDSCVLQVKFSEQSPYKRGTVSEFQSYILNRIKMQAALVQKVWLGSATHVEAELQDKLIHVWASIRNSEPPARYTLLHFPDEDLDRVPWLHRFSTFVGKTQSKIEWKEVHRLDAGMSHWSATLIFNTREISDFVGEGSNRQKTREDLIRQLEVAKHDVLHDPLLPEYQVARSYSRPIGPLTR